MAKKQSIFRLGAEKTEEETLLSARAWWRNNWLPIVGGLVVSIVGVSTWYGWQGNLQDQRQMAAEIYFDLLKEEDLVHAAVLLSQLEEYDDTVYLSLGKLQRVRHLAEEGNLDKAVEYLQWVIDNSSQSSIALLARYRLLRVLLGQGKYQEVVDSLQEYDYSATAEAYLVELKGDAYAGLGRSKEAIKAYTEALSSNPSPTPLLEMKLQNLGG